MRLLIRGWNHCHIVLVSCSLSVSELVVTNTLLSVGFGWMRHVSASGGKTAPAFCTFLQTCTFGTARHGFGVGVGWGGDVNVHVNLRHMRVLRHMESRLRVSCPYPCTSSIEFCETVSDQKTMLITDRAPCYPSLSAKFGWRHEACNHSKGIFCIKNGLEIRRFWFTQVGWMQCVGCQNRPCHVGLRPKLTARWIQSWCEASGSGNGVG